jgi:hypothetical protein
VVHLDALDRTGPRKALFYLHSNASGGRRQPRIPLHGMTLDCTLWSAEHVEIECSRKTLRNDQIIDPLDRLHRQTPHQVPVGVEGESGAGMSHLVGDVFARTWALA